MGIYDMIVGRKYLIGDGLGYCVVYCVAKVGKIVKVKTEKGEVVELFEEPDCGYSTYVEPR